MGTKKRIFMSGAYNHCYQNTKEGHLLFYDAIDHLVHFSIVCICASRYNIRFVSLCQMPDHVHEGIIAENMDDLSNYKRDSSSIFVRFGQAPNCKMGPIFNMHYGSAVKKDLKSIRTNIIYLGNNPVERQLCRKAEDYRWNYLAYANNDHPFSKPLIIRKASAEMKKAIKEIKGTQDQQKPLSRTILKRLFRPLSHKERLQLIDFIVCCYSVIDYTFAESLFGSHDNMIQSMKYNTGSEYDIKEVFVGRNDLCYEQITNWLKRTLLFEDVHDVFALSKEDRGDLLLRIYRETNIHPKLIAKYLRLSIIQK